ncbi:hypothetical protein [Salmonella enterica]|uniref:hypothetical protein n=1 Tax=Salmonella enterica TaxID=28901 RepID=UPI001F4800E5|nr:hypothetical protein [Salmonella enterica]
MRPLRDPPGGMQDFGLWQSAGGRAGKVLNVVPLSACNARLKPLVVIRPTLPDGSVSPFAHVFKQIAVTA